MKITHSLRALSFVIVHWSLFILLAACSAGSGEPQPPDIHYGEDVCDACGMLISDAKFAAASVDQDGTAHKFDDIGDLVDYYTQHDKAKVKAYFVHDYPSEKWLRAEQAFFVVSPKIQTPMAHGVAAYADRVAAEAAAQKYGVKVMKFDELRQMPMNGMQMP
jgi:copper chaperone NosL